MSWSVDPTMHNLLILHRAQGLQLLALAMLCDCVIPAGLSEQPPEARSPPFILADLTQPSAEGAVFTPTEAMPLFLVPVEDENLDDALYLRPFVDYDPGGEITPSQPRMINATGSIVRTFSFTFDPCQGMVDVDRTMTVVVSDRTFLESGLDGGLPYQETTGLTDQTFWRIHCAALASSTDGGL